MRVLVVSPRMPAAAGKGDQLRSFQFAQALASEHEVAVVTTGAGTRVAGAEEAISAFAALHVVPTPVPARVLGAAEALLRGQPAQVGWMTPRRAWRAVRRRAADADVVLAASVRALRGPLPVPVVLDHVDALSVNLRRRAAGTEPAPIRWAARVESLLLRRWERRLSGSVVAQLVISPVDARAVPLRPRVHVVPNSVELSARTPKAAGDRDIDVVLTGNMRYPPNADAAAWLSEAIAPAIWRARPETSVWVVGRDAGRLALDGRIQVRADVPDVASYLQRAKVAIAPLRIGTGSPNKVLEAMAVGTGVVATPAVVDSFDFPSDVVARAATAEEFAAEVRRLLQDREARERLTRRAGAHVARYGIDSQRGHLTSILAAAAGRSENVTGIASTMGDVPRRDEAGSKLVVERIEDMKSLRHEWSSLGERTGNLFATWEWNSVWWERFGGGRRLIAAACRDESGSLVGLLPVYVAVAAGPVRIIRLVGHGQGDRLGPICLPADRPRVAAALRAALRSKPWANALLVAERLPAEDGWSASLDARVLSREGSPVLELATSDWEEFLAGRSTSLRKQVRYQERRLAREHDLRYGLVQSPEELPGAMDTLFALHGTRWGLEAAPEYLRAQSFHREFAARALARGWLRLWLLEVDGRVVAAWHGFRFGGADWHYQSGRDLAWDRYSVGAVLLAHTIRDCVEAGVRRYLFLRGGEAYKSRFATADPGLETAAVGTGAVGPAAVAVAAGVRRLPPAGRRRIMRALGPSGVRCA